MTEQEMLRIDRELWDAWNTHDPERYTKLLDENWVAESDTIHAPITGRLAAREFMNMYVTAFPDLHFRVQFLYQRLRVFSICFTRSYLAFGKHPLDDSGKPTCDFYRLVIRHEREVNSKCVQIVLAIARAGACRGGIAVQGGRAPGSSAGTAARQCSAAARGHGAGGAGKQREVRDRLDAAG